MILPFVEQVLVERRKVVEYLLNPLHPEGATKARFFLAAGFNIEDWQDLAKPLCGLAERFPISSGLHTGHGWKYIVDGDLLAPTGRVLRVRTVWIVESGSTAPRLITAYPVKE